MAFVRLKNQCALATLAATLLFAGCEKKDAGTPTQAKVTEAIVVSLVPSRVEPVQRSVSVVGTLFGDEEAIISAKVPGRVVEIVKDMGDRASAGDMLAQIDKTDYELEKASKEMAYRQSLAKLGLKDAPADNFDLNSIPTVQRAVLQAQNAKAKFERAKKMFDQKPPLMSEQDYADMKTAYDVAKSEADVELLTAQSSSRPSAWQIPRSKPRRPAQSPTRRNPPARATRSRSGSCPSASM
jgi:multidrug efflux pump subunit AcrA (membrane-fusion protein)